MGCELLSGEKVLQETDTHGLYCMCAVLQSVLLNTVSFESYQVTLPVLTWGTDHIDISSVTDTESPGTDG